MCGWIKMHRSLLQWEWFQKPEMVQLFVYLLLKASVEDRKWQGLDVKRGQVVTSVSTICRDLSLSTKKVRNCLEHLKNSQVISIKTTNKFSVITICNYATYQAYETPEGQTEGKQRANEGQTEGKQRATSKEYKNDKNNIIINNRGEEKIFSNQLLEEPVWIESMQRRFSLTIPEIETCINVFNEDLVCNNAPIHETFSEYLTHFNNWVRIYLLNKKRNESTKKNKRDGYYEPTATSADDYYNSSF